MAVFENLALTGLITTLKKIFLAMIITLMLIIFKGTISIREQR